MPRGVYNRKQKRRARKYKTRENGERPTAIAKRMGLLETETRRYTIKEIIAKLEVLDEILN